MDVNTINTRFYNQLYCDYITQPDSLSPYLTNYKSCHWPDLINAVNSGKEIHNSVKKYLADQNADLSTAAARRNLDRLQRPTSVMVVTGQQLGLFASPLYTVYKALTAIKLSEKLNHSFPDISFIPVFWMESEDHDFAEVNHIGLWDQELNPRKLVYQGKNLGKSPVRYYQIDTDISHLLEEIKTCLLPTEFSESLWSLLADIYRTGRNWVEAAGLFFKFLFS